MSLSELWVRGVGATGLSCWLELLVAITGQGYWLDFFEVLVGAVGGSCWSELWIGVVGCHYQLELLV